MIQFMIYLTTIQLNVPSVSDWVPCGLQGFASELNFIRQTVVVSQIVQVIQDLLLTSIIGTPVWVHKKWVTEK